MVNNLSEVLRPTVKPLPVAAVVIGVYLAVVAVTLVALAILSFTDNRLATSHAWGHAIVVAVFAVVLPLRLRAARAGSRDAIRAVGLIGAVLFLVNVVEALIPGFVPDWMRAEMYVIAGLMLLVVLDVVRWGITTQRR